MDVSNLTNKITTAAAICYEGCKEATIWTGHQIIVIQNDWVLPALEKLKVLSIPIFDLFNRFAETPYGSLFIILAKRVVFCYAAACVFREANTYESSFWRNLLKTTAVAVIVYNTFYAGATLAPFIS